MFLWRNQMHALPPLKSTAPIHENGWEMAAAVLRASIRILCVKNGVHRLVPPYGVAGAPLILHNQRASALVGDGEVCTQEKGKTDSEGIRTPAGRAQWISSPSP